MSVGRSGAHPGLLVGIGTFVACVMLCCGLASCVGPTVLAEFIGDDGSAAGQEPSPAWAVGDRHNRLAAAGGPRRYEMEFADASTGYVLFLSCTRPCPATLYGTTDGGRTWVNLPLDLDGADAVTLTVADPKRVAVSENRGWSSATRGPERISAFRGGSDRWRTVAEGQPIDIGWHGVVSAGGGAVAIFGDGVRHLFDDGTWRTASPTGVWEASRLADGSLQGSKRGLQGVWLGTRTGADFEWAFVTVEPV